MVDHYSTSLKSGPKRMSIYLPENSEYLKILRNLREVESVQSEELDITRRNIASLANKLISKNFMQKEIAKELGLSQTSILKIKKGQLYAKGGVK